MRQRTANQCIAWQNSGNRQKLRSILQQFDNMSLNCFQRLGFLLLLLALAVPALSFDWQGTGNMTQDNMTQIKNTIQAYAIADPLNADGEARSISQHLNTIWNPAWNVFIVTSLVGYDVVVYGYAFRGHWMWINNVFINSNTMKDNRFAYLIWKDYNCQGWATFSELMGSGSTFTQDQITIINNYAASGPTTDPWGNAHAFVNFLNSNNQFNRGAYTAIMSESQYCIPSGYMCLVNRNFHSQNPFGGLNEGSLFVFQTRTISA